MTTVVSFRYIQVFLTAKCGFDKVGGGGWSSGQNRINPGCKKLTEGSKQFDRKKNPLYQKFEWYSEANFTVASEYYGELKLFLIKVLKSEEGSYLPYRKELQQLLKFLKRIW